MASRTVEELSGTGVRVVALLVMQLTPLFPELCSLFKMNNTSMESCSTCLPTNPVTLCILFNSMHMVLLSNTWLFTIFEII